MWQVSVILQDFFPSSFLFVLNKYITYQKGHNIAINNFLLYYRLAYFSHSFDLFFHKLLREHRSPRLIVRTTRRDFSYADFCVIPTRAANICRRAKRRERCAVQMNLSRFKNNVAARAQEKLQSGALRGALNYARCFTASYIRYITNAFVSTK